MPLQGQKGAARDAMKKAARGSGRDVADEGRVPCHVPDRQTVYQFTKHIANDKTTVPALGSEIGLSARHFHLSGNP
jgi:hypothetical protein